MRKTVPDAETLEAVNAIVANGITACRMLFSLALLALSPHSYPFAAFYLLCGVTDMLDGFAARKLHTESEKGAMLDSAADLLFAFVYAVKVLPLLNIPLWIWIWTAILAVTKITGIMIASKRIHRLSIEHSFGNRLTGLFLSFSVIIDLVNCMMPQSSAAADIEIYAEDGDWMIPTERMWRFLYAYTAFSSLLP